MSIPLILLLAAGLASGEEKKPLDLAKLRVLPTKEPAYESPPRYALMVCGPRAQVRMWAAVDIGAHAVDLDRNGDGDLTAADERIEGRRLLTDSGFGAYIEVPAVQMDGNRTMTERFQISGTKEDHDVVSIAKPAPSSRPWPPAAASRIDFGGPVRVPARLKADRVMVSLSFPAWKGVKVAPARVEFRVVDRVEDDGEGE